MHATVRIPFPDANGLSKNRTKRVGKGRMFVSAEGRTARAIIEDELTKATQDMTWKQNRIHVEIILYRAGPRKDAVNFVDEVCDAVEKVTGINDSWFEASVRWELTEKEELVVTVTQDDNAIQARICAKCHRILPEEEFGQRTGGCRPCVLAYNRAAYKKRREQLSGGCPHDERRPDSALAGSHPGGGGDADDSGAAGAAGL